MYSLYNSVNVLSPIYCSTVAKTYSGLTGRVSLRTDLAMVDQRSWVHVLSVISRGCVWEIDVWVLPALLQRLKGGVCVCVGGGGSAYQCSDHTPHTASNWSAWLSLVFGDEFVAHLKSHQRCSAGFLQTSQVLPHWLNHHFSLILVLYTETLSC